MGARAPTVGSPAPRDGCTTLEEPAPVGCAQCDGFLVAFDDSAAAVRCAQAAQASFAELGRELRAGVHVGDVSPMGSHDVAGLAVRFAQRLCGRADGGQVLVSAAVREACIGDGLQFVPQGTVQLKGIPGDWEVFEVRPERPGGGARWIDM